MGYQLTGVYIRPNGTEQQIRPSSHQTVQTFDFENDGDLNWTPNDEYGAITCVSSEGWTIGGKTNCQSTLSMPNSVFTGTLNSIKFYFYKSSTTGSYKGVAVGVCNNDQSVYVYYSRLGGSGGRIDVNGNLIVSNAVDPTGETTIEYVMESNGDLTVIINGTNTYNLGSYASQFQTLWTNKDLRVVMARWQANNPPYIRKIEITTE